jgi:hypothetical protein
MHSSVQGGVVKTAPHHRSVTVPPAQYCLQYAAFANHTSAQCPMCYTKEIAVYVVCEQFTGGDGHQETRPPECSLLSAVPYVPALVWMGSSTPTSQHQCTVWHPCSIIALHGSPVQYVTYLSPCHIQAVPADVFASEIERLLLRLLEDSGTLPLSYTSRHPFVLRNAFCSCGRTGPVFHLTRVLDSRVSLGWFSITSSR